MTQDRFLDIKAGLSSSTKMMLDHIKRYLDAGKASAFVGAGFSKNALVPDTVEMKDWNRLGYEFYKRLYGHAPEGNEAIFLNPIHLASEVDSAFGRNELDTIILRSLPDDAIIPGELHKNFLKLKWVDVFTTNYDRLLERAYLDSGRAYSIVTNKTTLLYSKSPRIIKLHGSFPDIRPFIITEEDYRTYPAQYPEFVNTVRQSLIEQLFCLIGFSGDDPNFKSWLGWLRDVMGDQITPVYLITYNKKLHNAQRKLCADQKIDILNLADLPKIDSFQEGYDFFFKYLLESANTLWTGQVRSMYGSIKTTDDLQSITEEMRLVRKSYPGWLSMPLDYYKYFSDVSSNIAIFSWDKITGLTWPLKISFLYEINWRQTISNSPIGFDWFVDSLTNLPYSSEDFDDENAGMVLELKLALLSYYRKKGNFNAYVILVEELEGHRSSMLPAQLRRFYYDRCIKSSVCLEYDQLHQLLKEWSVPFTDYVGVLWKSSILAEIGRQSEAISMLNDSLQHIRRTILTLSEDSFFMQSCWTAIRKALHFYTFEHIDTKEEFPFDAYKTMLHFQRKLMEPRKQPGRLEKHSFHVGRTSSSWHLGSGGFYPEYLWSYRYFSLCEALGQSHGTMNCHIDKELNTFFLEYIFPFAEPYSIGIMVRSNTKDYVKQCISRKNLSVMKAELVDMVFEQYLPCMLSPLKDMAEPLRKRVLNVLAPLLSKLSTKASLPYLIELHKIHQHIYENYSRNIDRDSINVLYENLPLTEYTKVQLENLKLPYILDNVHNQDYPQLGFNLNQLSIDEQATQKIVEGLSDEHLAIQRMALYRANIALLAKGEDGLMKRISQAVVDWRNRAKKGDLLRKSFEYAPEEPGRDKHVRKDLLRMDLKRLKDLDLKNIHSSETLETMEHLLEYYSIFSDLLNDAHHAIIVSKFAELVLNNEKLLTQDDEEDLFGGFYTYMSNVENEMVGYLFKTQHLNLPADVIWQLKESVAQLKKWNYKYLSMEVMLLQYDKSYKETEIKKDIEEKIALRNYYIDAVQALIFLSKKNKNFQGIIHRIIHFSMFSNSNMVHWWLHYLMLFIKNDMLLKGTHAELLKMLDHIYAHLEESTDDVEVINDIFTNTAKVAGAAAKKWGDCSETEKWKYIATSGKNIFNEVRYAYDYGYELEIDK